MKGRIWGEIQEILGIKTCWREQGKRLALEIPTGRIEYLPIGAKTTYDRLTQAEKWLEFMNVLNLEISRLHWSVGGRNIPLSARLNVTDTTWWTQCSQSQRVQHKSVDLNVKGLLEVNGLQVNLNKNWTLIEAWSDNWLFHSPTGDKVTKKCSRRCSMAGVNSDQCQSLYSH